MKGVKTKGICQTPHSPPGRKQADTPNHLQIPFRKKEGWLRGQNPNSAGKAKSHRKLFSGLKS